MLSDEVILNLAHYYLLNMQAMKTVINTVLDENEPFPDPRDVAKMIEDLGVERLAELFKNEEFLAEIRRQIDLMDVTAAITGENATIFKMLLGIEP